MDRLLTKYYRSDRALVGGFFAGILYVLRNNRTYNNGLVTLHLEYLWTSAHTQTATYACISVYFCLHFLLLIF